VGDSCPDNSRNYSHSILRRRVPTAAHGTKSSSRNQLIQRDNAKIGLAVGSGCSPSRCGHNFLLETHDNRLDPCQGRDRNSVHLVHSQHSRSNINEVNESVGFGGKYANRVNNAIPREYLVNKIFAGFLGDVAKPKVSRRNRSACMREQGYK